MSESRRSSSSRRSKSRSNFPSINSNSSILNSDEGVEHFSILKLLQSLSNHRFYGILIVIIIVSCIIGYVVIT